MDNVITREDRTAIAQTGASIDEIGKHYVIVRATPQEVSLIAALGYPVEVLVQVLWTSPRPMRPIIIMPRWATKSSSG